MEICQKNFEFFYYKYYNKHKFLFNNGKVVASAYDPTFNKTIDYVAIMLVSIARDMYYDYETCIEMLKLGYETGQSPKASKIVDILKNIKYDEVKLRITLIVKTPGLIPEILVGYFTSVDCYKIPLEYLDCKPVVEILSGIKNINSKESRSIEEYYKDIIKYNSREYVKMALVYLIYGQSAFDLDITLENSKFYYDKGLDYYKKYKSFEFNIAEQLYSPWRDRRQSAIKDINIYNVGIIFTIVMLMDNIEI